ncbi:hypothetical protein WS70_17720 [Burkholderia mayonis]|uniref:protein O-GlcNAc transferase n=2 Tax=Burkholderia mayonis TaxID=1385591 RepID=A0A1B4FJ96_9BURK|nr:hypothetical protein WS70_17720 [Burkholderia mayonis]KVE42492.1 hypothetical protein WS70_11790 [Burkholderia mayonis]
MSADLIKRSLVALLRVSIAGGLADRLGNILTSELLDAASDPDMYYLAGNVELRAGNFERAMRLFLRASELAPRWDAPLNNLGVCYERRNRREDAYRCYAMAAARAPRDKNVVRNAAFLAFNLGTEHYRRIAAEHLAALLEHHPADAGLHAKLGYVHFHLGDRERALTRAMRAVELDSQCVAGIVQKVAFRLPVAYRSSDEIDAVRSELRDALDDMADDVDRAVALSPVSPDAFRDVWCDALFYLTYNGRSNVDLIGRFSDQLGRLMRSAFPAAEASAARAWRTRRRQAGGRKIRLAFVSAFFNGHSIWKIPTVGYYEHLDRDVVEIFTYHVGTVSDRFTDDARRLSDAFFASTLIHEVIERLTVDAPDAIVFPDVGMHFVAYCLTCLRLAPLQVQLLGHPDTSGSAAIDYVVSPSAMESPGADAFYRETLLRLPGLGCAYSFDYPKPAAVTRAFFGFAPDDIVFVSPQSTFKYVPEDDDIYPLIALRVGPRCRFAFFPRSDESSVRIFEDRMRRAFARHRLSYDAHVTCLRDPLSQPEFIALCASGDLFLDNPAWSGHNTVLDALHGGAVVLCVEGSFMRQRHAAALMRHLDFPQLVARDKAELIDLCARHARDAAFRDEYRTLLAERLPALASAESVYAFQAFLIERMEAISDRATAA